MKVRAWLKWTQKYLLVADADGVFVLAIETAQQYLEQFQHLETEEKIKKDNFFRLNEINEYYF